MDFLLFKFDQHMQCSSLILLILDSGPVMLREPLGTERDHVTFFRITLSNLMSGSNKKIYLSYALVSANVQR